MTTGASLVAGFFFPCCTSGAMAGAFPGIDLAFEEAGVIVAFGAGQVCCRGRLARFTLRTGRTSRTGRTLCALGTSASGE